MVNPWRITWINSEKVKMGMISKFQEELRNTEIPLDDLLRKYGLNLESGFKLSNPTEQMVKPEKTTTVRNIICKNGRYYINKCINYERFYYGSYDCLEDAERVVEKLREKDWDFLELNNICKELNVKRKRHKDTSDVVWHNYTLWDKHKVRFIRAPAQIKKFRVRYNSYDVNMGCFLDFVTCEVIHDLIKEAVNIGFD